MTTTDFPPRFPATRYDYVEYVPTKNWIGGQWQEPSTGKTIPVENPMHGKAMSNVPISGAKDVDQAVAEAKKAFQSWRQVPLKERAILKRYFRELGYAHVDETDNPAYHLFLK